MSASLLVQSVATLGMYGPIAALCTRLLWDALRLAQTVRERVARVREWERVHVQLLEAGGRGGSRNSSGGGGGGGGGGEVARSVHVHHGEHVYRVDRNADGVVVAVERVCSGVDQFAIVPLPDASPDKTSRLHAAVFRLADDSYPLAQQQQQQPQQQQHAHWVSVLYDAPPAEQ